MSVLPFPRSDVLSPTPTQQDFARDVGAHLARTQLAWAVGKDRCDLLMPGHSPVHFPEFSARLATMRAGGATPFYEEVTTILLSFLMDRFRTFVFYDVGAADGYFSRVAASFGGAPIAVHAFEMHPDTIARLQERAMHDPLFRRIQLHHAGLTSHHRGERQVWFARSRLFEFKPKPREYREGIGRTLRLAMRPDPARALKQTTMLLTSIDAFVSSSRAMPDIIKIDVEGYESAVLAGACATMSSCRPFILLELHKDKKVRFGLSRREVVDLVLRRGYQALFLTDHEDRRRCSVVPVDRDHPLLGRQETDLILFFHPERLQSLRCVR